MWEIGIKAGLGKIRLHAPFEQIFPDQLRLNSIELLPITAEHVRAVIQLPFHHRDPFDRLLAAQALSEGIPIISVDTVLDAYGITRLW